MTAFAALILVMGVAGYSIWRMGDVPESLSAISYVIPHWLFSVWIMATGMLLMPALMDALSPNYQWMGFLMVLGMACVAASPYYKTEQVHLHYIGAVVCFAFAQMVVVVTVPLLLLMWAAYPLVLLRKLRRWWVLIAEMICLTEIMIVI